MQIVFDDDDYGVFNANYSNNVCECAKIVKKISGLTHKVYVLNT